jgi:UDP-glucose 4-epimerase
MPVPKNIYGVTKVAAETLCELFHRNQGLPCLILRTARFFPEPDDSAAVRERYSDANAKANEYLYRRVDIEDIVRAHLLAVQKAPAIGFGRYIISATTPFTHADLAELHRDAPAVVRRYFPAFAEIYAHHGWQMFSTIDRVYINARARTDLGWRPRYDFAELLTMLANGQTDLRSPLAQAVGVKGYHGPEFADGLYPVAEQR